MKAMSLLTWTMWGFGGAKAKKYAGFADSDFDFRFMISMFSCCPWITVPWSRYSGTVLQSSFWKQVAQAVTGREKNLAWKECVYT